MPTSTRLSSHQGVEFALEIHHKYRKPEKKLIHLPPHAPLNDIIQEIDHSVSPKLPQTTFVHFGTKGAKGEELKEVSAQNLWKRWEEGGEVSFSVEVDEEDFSKGRKEGRVGPAAIMLGMTIAVIFLYWHSIESSSDIPRSLDTSQTQKEFSTFTAKIWEKHGTMVAKAGNSLSSHLLQLHKPSKVLVLVLMGDDEEARSILIDAVAKVYRKRMERIDCSKLGQEGGPEAAKKLTDPIINSLLIEQSSVIVLDNVEKAGTTLYELQQVLHAGTPYLTDPNHGDVNARGAIFILNSNLGKDKLSSHLNEREMNDVMTKELQKAWEDRGMLARITSGRLLAFPSE